MELTIWYCTQRLYDFGSTCMMMVFQPNNTSYCARSKIGAQWRVFLFGALMKKVKQCYMLETQTLQTNAHE